MVGDQGSMAPSRGDLQALRLLCTNDDGILAQGLACLIEAAEPLGEITVVAPDREQSATSHSLTLHHPIRPIERGERRYHGCSSHATRQKSVLGLAQANAGSVGAPDLLDRGWIDRVVG